MNLLKFSKGNKKLSKDTLILSLPAGLTCPGSNNCKAWVTLKDDKRVLNRGDETIFTCFAASEELRYPNVYKSRRYNFFRCVLVSTVPSLHGDASEESENAK